MWLGCITGRVRTCGLGALWEECVHVVWVHYRKSVYMWFGCITGRVCVCGPVDVYIVCGPVDVYIEAE